MKSLGACLGAWLGLAACCTAAWAASNAEPPAGTPAERLAALCAGGSAPAADKLKGPYLEWQWLRLANRTVWPQNRPLFPGHRLAPPLDAAELAQLEAWFKAEPNFREKFLLALDPAEDDMPAAARVALALRARFPKESAALPDLVIAFATVWDMPEVVAVEAAMGVPELFQTRPAICPYADSFGWFVKNLGRFCPWFRTTPWRLLVYVADESLDLAQRDSLLAKYSFNVNQGKVYSEIAYDKSKLVDNIGRLAGRPYTLENLAKYGGVCRDQAYYARAVCRAFGLPAYMASGVARTGLGHAWVGWIVREGPGYRLLSHGRYAYDKYFTARILEPSSGHRIYDYMVAIEARALSDERTYEQAELYYRVWREACAQLSAVNRANLLIAAVQKNAYHRAAWLALAEATAGGDLPREFANPQWEYLTTRFREFPDFIFAMSQNFSRMFKTVDERFRFYEMCAKLFKDLQRQDLVGKLRVQEVQVLVKEDHQGMAAQVALKGMEECAGEGAEGAELAKQAFELMRELKQERALLQPLRNALTKTPQERAELMSPYWVEIATFLRDLLIDLGDKPGALALQNQMDALKSRARH